MRSAFVALAAAIFAAASIGCCSCCIPPPAGQGGAAAKEKVTRSNYHRIKEGMTRREVEDILGFGREAASDGRTQIVTWRADGFGGCVISITFDGGEVAAKSIIGD